ncbi:hypothetical protein ACFT5C_10260 [Streptomyces sp. NPDC057116]|uniref:hypothetical protein n=1 Tax=Streptomyces sp. NPDC057116 TaxID=3346023 RepID=UPI0036411BA7
MARFNIRRAATAAGRAVSPVRSTAPTTTHQGGAGVLRDPRSELFLLAVANFVTQTTFYESGGARDDRFTALVRELAVEDPEWTAGLLRWLRGEGNMRTASIVGAAEYVKARLEASATEGPTGRQVVASVLQRADEPGELLGYWTSRYGRNVPKPVKRGVADAVRRLYTARSLLKYDTAGKDYRFGDILNLVHASPDPAKQPWQGELFRAPVPHRAGESVLTVLGRFRQLGGTNTTEAVRAHYRGHDRVLIVTDEQASFSHYGNPVQQVPPRVPVYTWNLAGYRPGHAPSGNAYRHTFGGLTDTAFRMVPLLEAGRSAHWPWSAAA